MNPRSKDWHISGWPVILLAPLAFPIAILFRLLPFKRTSDRTVEDVAGFLRDFAEGTGDDWDWDDFTSVPITDPKLDAIRKQADLIQLPVDSAGREQLKTLLCQAEALTT